MAVETAVETAVEAARRFGDRAAFVTDEGLSLGYAEFDRICDETAVGLAAQGDVVALALPPTPEHFIAYLAAAKLGAVTAGVNPKLVASESEDNVGPGPAHLGCNSVARARFGWF